jgi:hypothetical protein
LRSYILGERGYRQIKIEEHTTARRDIPASSFISSSFSTSQNRK